MLPEVNWRREGLFLAIAGMETCWIAGWSRALLRRPEVGGGGLTWWSVWGLYVMALIVTRALSRLRLRGGVWILTGLALLGSFLLIQINLDSSAGRPDWGWLPDLVSRQAEPEVARKFLAWLLGLLIWVQAMRVPACFGDVRATLRRFQVGVLLVAGLVLFSLRFEAPVTDLVLAYFGLGLLTLALTRIEEVAEKDPRAAGTFGRKWGLTLAAALLLTLGGALLLSRVVTVDVVRWILTPLITLAWMLLFAVVVLFSFLLSQLLPLIAYLLGDDLSERFRETLEGFGESVQNVAPEQGGKGGPNLALAQALQGVFVVGLLLLLVGLLVYSFRKWRLRQYGTSPGGVRETVEPEGTWAQDVVDYVRHLRRRADLGRWVRRPGDGSVMAIYASLQAWLAAGGYPRRPEQTPYEYQTLAQEALPAHQAQVQAITEAYVRVHYGQDPVDARELSRLQRAWRRIKAARRGER